MPHPSESFSPTDRLIPSTGEEHPRLTTIDVRIKNIDGAINSGTTIKTQKSLESPMSAAEAPSRYLRGQPSAGRCGAALSEPTKTSRRDGMQQDPRDPAAAVAPVAYKPLGPFRLAATEWSDMIQGRR